MVTVNGISTCPAIVRVIREDRAAGSRGSHGKSGYDNMYFRVGFKFVSGLINTARSSLRLDAERRSVDDACSGKVFSTRVECYLDSVYGREPGTDDGFPQRHKDIIDVIGAHYLIEYPHRPLSLRKSELRRTIPPQTLLVKDFHSIVSLGEVRMVILRSV